MKPRWISPEDYLRQEETATEKSEYFDGEIFTMAAGTHNHEEIGINVVASWRAPVRQKRCTLYASNIKILVQRNGLFTYPDAMVISGRVQFAPGRSDTITNPTLIVEVLPDSTKSYDRGDKFALYRGLESFAHYLLIHQDQPRIEYHRKTPSGWLLNEIAGLDATLNIPELELELSLRELYQGVDWLPASES